MGLYTKCILSIIIIFPYFIFTTDFYSEFNILLPKIINTEVEPSVFKIIFSVYFILYFICLIFGLCGYIVFDIISGLITICNSYLFYKPFSSERNNYLDYFPHLEVLYALFIGIYFIIHGIIIIVQKIKNRKYLNNNNDNHIGIIDISLLNNLEQNYNFKLNNSIDKKLIEELKFRVDDLEKKLSNTLSQTKEKETISFNNEKLIKEFENLVTENTRETMLISYEKNLLENQAKSLRSALRNATNEIDILNREIRKDEQNCKNLYIDYEKKVEEEKKEEDNFKKIIMEKEKEINRLSIKKEQDSFNKNLTTNNSNNKSKIDLKEFFEKNSTMFGENQKMKMEISALNDIILNLQIEIANLKRKLYKLEEDENKLKEIIEYKDKKANYLQKNINDLNKQVLIKNMQSKSNRKIIMKKENELINIQNHLIEGEKVNEINNDVKDGEDEFV